MDYATAVEEGLQEVISVATQALEDMEGVLIRMDDPVPAPRRRRRVWPVVLAVGLTWLTGMIMMPLQPGHWYLNLTRHVVTRVDTDWNAEMAPRSTH